MRPLALVAPIVVMPLMSCVVVGPSCPSGSAAIFVSPSTVVVAVGASVTPSATWCDRGRHERVYPHWTVAPTTDAPIIDVDPASGRITGRREGQTTVVVAYEPAGVAARIPVTVR